MEGVASEVEKVDHEMKATYQSVLTRASEESKMVEVLSTFNISYDVFVSKYFLFFVLKVLPVLLNYWNTNPFTIDAYNTCIYIKKLMIEKGMSFLF